MKQLCFHKEDYYIMFPWLENKLIQSVDEGFLFTIIYTMVKGDNLKFGDEQDKLDRKTAEDLYLMTLALREKGDDELLPDPSILIKEQREKEEKKRKEKIKFLNIQKRYYRYIKDIWKDKSGYGILLYEDYVFEINKDQSYQNKDIKKLKEQLKHIIRFDEVNWEEEEKRVDENERNKTRSLRPDRRSADK